MEIRWKFSPRSPPSRASRDRHRILRELVAKDAKLVSLWGLWRLRNAPQGPRATRAEDPRFWEIRGKFKGKSDNRWEEHGTFMGFIYICIYIYRLIGVFVGNSCDIGTFMGTIDKTWVDHGWSMENSWECGKIWQTTGWFLGNWYHGTLPRIFDMGWS